MGTGAADFGGLVSAFHCRILGKQGMLHNCIKPGKPSIITNFVNCGNRLGVFLRVISFYNTHQVIQHTQ
jgi:hypothetical protein